MIVNNIMCITLMIMTYVSNKLTCLFDIFDMFNTKRIDNLVNDITVKKTQNCTKEEDSWGHFIDVEYEHDKILNRKPVIFSNVHFYVIPIYNYNENKLMKQIIKK